jgi:hypothetical protein
MLSNSKRMANTRQLYLDDCMDHHQHWLVYDTQMSFAGVLQVMCLQTHRDVSAAAQVSRSSDSGDVPDILGVYDDSDDECAIYDEQLDDNDAAVCDYFEDILHYRERRKKRPASRKQS